MNTFWTMFQSIILKSIDFKVKPWCKLFLKWVIFYSKFTFILNIKFTKSLASFYCCQFSKLVLHCVIGFLSFIENFLDFILSKINFIVNFYEFYLHWWIEVSGIVWYFDLIYIDKCQNTNHFDINIIGIFINRKFFQ